MGDNSHMKEIATQRAMWEKRWYLAKRFLAGDHYLYYSRRTGKLVKLTSTDNKIRRSIDLSFSIRRSLKNKIARDPIWSVRPTDPNNVEASEEAKKAGFVLRYYWRFLHLKTEIKKVVGEALDTSVGFIYVGFENDEIFVRPLSTFDVYIPMGASTISEAPYFFVARRRQLKDIKKDEEYDAIKDGELARKLITADNKKSMSPYRDNLSSSGQDGTVIVSDKFEKTTKNKLGGSIKLTTTVNDIVLREVELPLNSYPVFEYKPEKEIDELYTTSWMERSIEINKIIDKSISEMETYMVKFKPKYTIPKGSGIRKISSSHEIIEYNASFPRAVGTLSPPAMPSTPVDLISMSKGLIEDVTGMHAASMGKLPSGVRAAKMVEALQMGDAENVSDPVDNLSKMLQDIGEFIFELLSIYQLKPKNIGYEDENLMIQGGKLSSSSSFKIDKRKVFVDLTSAGAWTEFGRRETLKELFDRKAIPVETLWEGYKFSNIQDLTEKMQNKLNQQIRGVSPEDQNAQPGENPTAQDNPNLRKPILNSEREVRP